MKNFIIKNLAPTLTLPHGGGKNCLMSIANLAIRERAKGFTLAEGATHVGTWKSSRQVAFTMAEVLITLGVIGVVAAMTLPTLIKNYQKSVIETQLKNSYSVLTQAIKLSEIDNDEVKYWSFPEENTDEQNQEFLKKYFFPYMKVIKNCGFEHGCWVDTEYRMSGTIDAGMYKPEYQVQKFVINDGTNIAFYTVPEKFLCHFYMDVNGYRGPNTRGKDIFEFILSLDDSNKNLYPNGYSDEYENVLSDCESLGHKCATILMNNGWHFPKDYPW